ncbi:hypothetical protein K438DRAFT_1869246 [Mycena galopus ATCC 62051]|nr:hypothetical protein K438DRAFT_1869246 [Mycena galopus ATCC 62051]
MDGMVCRGAGLTSKGLITISIRRLMLPTRNTSRSLAGGRSSWQFLGNIFRLVFSPFVP